MSLLHRIINYLCYCGIEKDEYRKLKKDAYVSNFEIWRVLHCLMLVVFAGLYLGSFSVHLLAANRVFYLCMLLYSALESILFLFVLKKDSIIAQLLIYLSISLLLLFACMITQLRPDTPATTFIVFLIIAPLFMIDKPYFMGIELFVASAIFLTWMHAVKTTEAWTIDAGNVFVFAGVGFVIHVIANSIRIKEFVLSRKLMIQKDTDELTGLKNKGALTREINEYMADDENTDGIMMLFDIDYFKSVNDIYGHDVGDDVLRQFGALLTDIFTDGEVVGRFGGDEFIIFIKGTSEKSAAENAAQRIVDGTEKSIQLPDSDKKVSVSIGIALYHGKETSYSDVFKKADVALYETKSERRGKYSVYEDAKQ